MSKSEEQRGQSSTDFFKNVSRDFLEREKIHLLLERIPGDYDTKTLQSKFTFEFVVLKRLIEIIHDGAGWNAFRLHHVYFVFHYQRTDNNGHHKFY